MKTSIIVTGQTGSKTKLTSACTTLELIREKRILNNFELVFPSKKAAIKALSEGYQYLREDKEDWEASSASYQRGRVLNYDAGTARIVNEQVK